MVNENIFINSELLISKAYHNEISEYIGKSDILLKPFKRYIDAWWFAFCIGIYNDIRAELSDITVKFQDGSILSSDSWRITFLELAGIGKYGSDVIFKPNQIITMANECANAGFLILIDMLRGSQDPTVTLFSSDFLENSISEFAKVRI